MLGRPPLEWPWGEAEVEPEESGRQRDQLAPPEGAGEAGDRLEEGTEGWAAGLQLAGLALRGQADTSAFTAAFAGTHRFVMDCLIEEVLSQQPPRLRRFLLETSVLERLSAPLCAALQGTKPSS